MSFSWLCDRALSPGSRAYLRRPTIACDNSKVVEGEKKIEKIEKDREQQRGNVAALERDIAANKKREQDSMKDQKKEGGRSRLGEAKAAVRRWREKLFFWGWAWARKIGG